MLPSPTSVCISSNVPETCPIHFNVIGFNAPLFRVEALDEACDDSTSSVLATCRTHFPQFHKRGTGWQLSVEEIYFLLWYSHTARDSTVLLPTASLRLSLSFATPELEESYHHLAKRNALACAAYTHFTTAHHLRLRHGGSLYGALFIGYQEETQQHGEFLIFAGPLEPLAAVRAVRVASSVGKRAVEVSFELVATVRDDSSSGEAAHELPRVVVRDLERVDEAAPTSGPPPQKRRRV